MTGTNGVSEKAFNSGIWISGISAHDKCTQCEDVKTLSARAPLKYRHQKPEETTTTQKKEKGKVSLA